MAVDTGSTSAALALEIDGRHAGFLRSFDGGGAFAEVIETPNTGAPTDKSIGTPLYDDIVASCQFPDGPLAAWVTEFLDGKAPVHDGAVILLDLNRQPVRRLEWHQGAVFSVAFPGLDAQAKESGLVTITIRPTTTKDVGGGSAVSTPAQKLTRGWLTGNFALSMPGIDCTRVTKVEPLVVTQTYLAPASGRGTPTPGPVHVGDLVVSVTASGASDFVRWGEDFIVAGHNTKSHEKDATIRYLAANLRDDVARLNVRAIGIFRVDHESTVTNAARTSQVRITMYAEQVQWAKGAETAEPAVAPAARPGTDRDVRDALGKRLAPADVVRRLREDPGTEQRPRGVASRRRLGRDVGFAWAQRHASPAELREVAAADDQDWSSLSLPEGHSLAETLAATLDTPLLYDGRLELPRDALAEGLLCGVLEALAEMNEHFDVPSG